VRIQVSRVDLDGRKIDFRLVNEHDGFASRPIADKAGARDVKARVPMADRFETDAGGRTPLFQLESRKRGATKTGRGAKAGAAKSSGRAAPASKKASRKKR
jgi:ribonuclease R